MATRRAVANGNWSSPGTWDGGTSIPGNGDTVYANGWNVTIDQNINIGGSNNTTVNATALVAGQYYEITFTGTTSFPGTPSNAAGTIFLATGAGTGTGTAKTVATISNGLTTNVSAGGQFFMSTIYNINCDVRCLGALACLSLSGSSNQTFSSIRLFGNGGSSLSSAISNSSTGTLTFNGCTLASLSSGSSGIVQLTGAGPIIATGCDFYALSGNGVAGGIYAISSSNISITGGTISGSQGGSVAGIYLTSSFSGVLSVNNCAITTNGTALGAIGNVGPGSISITSSTISAPSGGFAINNSGVGQLSISNSTISSVSGVAVSNTGTGPLNITNCDMVASGTNNAISSTGSINNSISGNFYDFWNGFRAIHCPRFKIGTIPTLCKQQFALLGTSNSYFTLYSSDFGTFGNPIAANVRSGVSYGGGNITGTCAVPAAGSVALGVPVDATTGTAVLDPAAVASAVWGAATRTLTSASGPTAAENASAVWAAGSRTVTGGTVDTLTNAPTVPTPSQIASQVRTELSTELARVDAAISSRLASASYTAPTTPPTAAQNATAVRTELAAELGRVDAAITTRATPANIPAADITAIKAKTDAINVDRINNTATLSQVGNLLAQANS
jgi:hypothetical protein